jgi:exportin-2 (importin alpha re-exporter)
LTLFSFVLLFLADLETFEDNPIEFIRKDIEGSDTDTRRRVASDLVRALCKQFEGEATAALLACVDNMLKSYAAAVTAGTAANYIEKDAAIALLIAVAVKTQVSALGVTGMNPLVDLGAYLTSHILSELSTAAAAPANVNVMPIVKAACLKFITTFRAQFTREQLLALLPMVVPFAGATSYVVHTYAANCVEKILTIKDKVPKPGAVGPVAVTISQSRLSVEDLSPHMTPLFSGLFALMSRPEYPENDYMMRACMRVVSFAGPSVAPFARQVISGLTIILGRVCANPSNPVFNHFLFETIACIMRNCVPSADSAAAGAGGVAASPSPAADASASGVTVADFEAMLFPPFQAVLSADVAEFQPYVFQLMALLLELRPIPNAGEHAITAGFQSLLPPLLTAEAWKRPGNVPALTMLMQAYLRRGAAYLHSSGNLVPLLGVWQNLLGTKNQEEHAFEILTALCELGNCAARSLLFASGLSTFSLSSLPVADEGCPLELFSGYMGTICTYLCQKLQESKSAKIARLFTHSSAFFVGYHGVGVLEASLNALQPGLFFQMLENVMLPQAPHIVGGKEAKQEAAVGFTRMLTEVPSLVQDPAKVATLNTLITVIVELLEPSSSSSVVVGAASSSTFFEEKDTGDLVEEAVQGEYSAAFAKLLFAQDRNRYAFKKQVPDPKAFFARSLVAASNTAPGKLPTVMRTNPAANTVQRYITAIGAALA